MPCITSAADLQLVRQLLDDAHGPDVSIIAQVRGGVVVAGMWTLELRRGDLTAQRSCMLCAMQRSLSAEVTSAIHLFQLDVVCAACRSTMQKGSATLMRSCRARMA